MTLAHLAQHHPRFVEWSIHVDRLPAAGWLALQFVALTPTWCWMVDRMRDGSDDPLGALALVSLAVLVWQLRHELRAAPRLGWMALATGGTLLAAVAHHGLGVVPALPPLAASLLAMLALACGLLAFLPKRIAALPVAGLAVLALPLLSSLQFYAGYPLRVVTAEASRWLLAPGFDVMREGSTLLIDGRMVIVDAPCSGVQMVWLGYFTACVVALWAQRTNRQFATRLPIVGLLVLFGNIMRNAVLVAFEGAGHAMAPWAHDAFGLLLLALVCGAIAVAMARRTATTVVSAPLFDRWFTNRFVDRAVHKSMFGAAMLTCLVWSATVALRAPGVTQKPIATFHEWPRQWDGVPLRPMALSDVEHRFADRFPGAIARMTDGHRLFVLRQVAVPTRMLHPAADCYRALGYRIAQARLERDAQERLWRCFDAERSAARNASGRSGGTGKPAQQEQTLRVCERIVDSTGASFTDTSAWYWAAVSGRSTGPWQAVTVASIVRSM